MNETIWFSARGENAPIREIAPLPAFDLMTNGIADEQDEQGERDEADQ